jgi:FkbM family methyltransferase
MIELIHTDDAGTVAVLKQDSHAATWIRDGKKFLHDPTVPERIVPMIKPGAVCVDAGANYGTFAWAMARAAGPQGHVYAFEPYAPMYACLAVNMREFPPCQVSVLNAGLGVLRRHLEMAPSVNAGATHIELNPSRPLAPSSLFLPLDDFQLPRLNFLKLDVEGWEPHVVAGAVETIARCMPIIFCEINHGAMARYGFTADDIMQPLFKLGYRMEFMDPGHTLGLPQLDVFFLPPDFQRYVPSDDDIERMHERLP